jgi:uncharacterized membrane protein YqaE (UPF0057 family)
MKYVLLWLFPPFAVLACGKPVTAFWNFILCLCLYFPGLIHAWSVVRNHELDLRTNRMIDAIRVQTESLNRTALQVANGCDAILPPSLPKPITALPPPIPGSRIPYEKRTEISTPAEKCDFSGLGQLA